MQDLQNFTLIKLHEKIALPDQDFEAWLIGMGLLHNRRTCQCGSEMNIRVKQDRKYGNWRCPRRECRREIGYLKGTFFEGTHLSLQKIFQLSYLWIFKYGTIDGIQHEIEGISRPTVIDWLNFFRDVCAEFFLRNPPQIGGPGRFVEIDETMVVKRKYGVGRILQKQEVWLFGGVERDTNWENCFLVPVRSFPNILSFLEPCG